MSLLESSSMFNVVVKSFAAISLCLLSNAGAAGLPDAARPAVRDAIATEGRVIVLFQTDKQAATVTKALSAAMRLPNTKGAMPARWVSEIIYQGYGQKSGCGVVIGVWWSKDSGDEGLDWERIVYDKIKGAVSGVTFQYARDGDLKVLSNTVGSKGNAIIESCISD
jgi:hypothetical protein